jgi:RNA polymerase sigma-70 factor (ECF subfamily)
MSATSDQKGFVEALDAHKKILFKVASAYCDNPADRQELMQEIAIALWTSFPRFDGRSKLSTWMYRVALNVAISFVRDRLRRTRHTVELDEAVLEVAAVAADEDHQRVIGELLGKLDALDRALVLLYVEGHDHGTIGEILGISPSNVATKINRIKQRLRADVQSQGG